jgi:hypothetical protein
MDETTTPEPPAWAHRAEPHVGDLWRIDDVVVAVTAVHPSHLRIHRCHRDLTMGYDFDLFVTCAGEQGTALAGPLVVCGELYGPVLRDQLDQFVGSIPPAHARAVADSLWTDAASLAELDRGTPLSGSDDPRRSYVADLLDAHNAMCAPARSALT